MHIHVIGDKGLMVRKPGLTGFGLETARSEPGLPWPFILTKATFLQLFTR